MGMTQTTLHKFNLKFIHHSVFRSSNLILEKLFPPLLEQNTCNFTMISHATLYNVANMLGALAMITVVLYHFVAVNAKRVTQKSVTQKS